jgi:hypothetical protein
MSHSDKDAPGFAQELAIGIKDNRALSIANVMGNRIGQEQLTKLQEIMHSKPNLVSLCGIADDATEADLSGLGMDADDAIILASELPDKGAMTSLNLASNQLGSKGARIVAEAIKVTICTPAIILTPFSCPSGFSIHCCCLLLSAGYGGIDQARYQQQLHRGCPGGGPTSHLRGQRDRARQVSSHETH